MGSSPYHLDSIANDFIPNTDFGNFSWRFKVWMNVRHITDLMEENR